MSNKKESSYEYTNKTQGFCDPSYLVEFEQGNFVHAAMQTRYTGQELLKIFLYSDEISETDKMKQLRYMLNKIRYIASDMDKEYDTYIIQHNNEVREYLRTAHQEYCQKEYKIGRRGISRIKFNNTRWQSEGGRSRPDRSVEYEDHEWHDRYLQKRKEYIRECMTYMLASKLQDPLEIVTEGAKYFAKGEYEEVVQNMDIVEHKKTKILETLQQEYLSLSKR